MAPTHSATLRLRVTSLAQPAAQVPLEFASMLAGMDRAIAEGAEDRITDTVQRLAGQPARTFHALLEREME